MSAIQQPDNSSKPVPKKGLITDNLDASLRALLKDGPTENQIFTAGDRTDVKQRHVKDKKEFFVPDKDEILNLKRKSSNVTGDETEDGKTTGSNAKTARTDDPDEVPLWKKLLADDDEAGSSLESPLPWLTSGVGYPRSAPSSLGSASMGGVPPGAVPPGIDPKDPVYMRQKELQSMQDRNMQMQMQMQEQQMRQQMMLSWIEHQKTMTNMIRATMKKLAEMEQEIRQEEHTATMKAGQGWIKALG